jgi:hypothetical protein
MNVSIVPSPLYPQVTSLRVDLFANNVTNNSLPLATGQDSLLFVDEELAEHMLLLRVTAKVVQYTSYNLTLTLATSDCNLVPVVRAQSLGSSSSESQRRGIIAGLGMLGGLIALVSKRCFHYFQS